MSFSSSTAAWIAIAAACVALLAVAIAAYAWTRLRTVRAAQNVLLGGGKADLVDFAVSLQARIDDLHRSVDEVAAGPARLGGRIDGCVAKTSIVRYDAYTDTGGHQSASLALLDSARSGIVLSAIQGRDYARIYLKELERGRAAVALSPEEMEAVERAMASWAAARLENTGFAGLSASPWLARAWYVPGVGLRPKQTWCCGRRLRVASTRWLDLRPCSTFSF